MSRPVPCMSAHALAEHVVFIFVYVSSEAVSSLLHNSLVSATCVRPDAVSMLCAQ